MSEHLRYEEWTQDQDGMVTTVVIEVRSGERVRIADEFLDEFGFDPEEGIDTVDSLRERFIRSFPYEKVAARLREMGWRQSAPATAE